jgi:hypothetical protein
MMRRFCFEQFVDGARQARLSLPLMGDVSGRRLDGSGDLLSLREVRPIRLGAPGTAPAKRVSHGRHA